MRWGSIGGLLAAAGLVAAQPATAAGGDLLVAPTRLVFEGTRGTEVILNNIGNETATYRVSLELRRMDADGNVEEIKPEAASESEKQAIAMISYAPRRISLIPNQPQAIRVGIRPPADLPDGEYRAHMLFRAIPATRPAAAAGAQPAQGMSISLQPIYGISIPVIVRKGALKASATLADPRLVRANGKAELSFAINRTGNRSTYGMIRVLKAGQAKPAYEIRGIGVYPEVTKRQVHLPIDATTAAAIAGPVTIQYLEDPESGGRLIAETKAVLK